MGSIIRDLVATRTLSSLAGIGVIRSTLSLGLTLFNNPTAFKSWNFYSPNMNGHSYVTNGTGNGKDMESTKEYVPILASDEASTRCSTVWNPLNIFTCPSTYKHALIILNRPIRWRESLLINVWEKASTTVTVDGGTDRWITFLGPQGEAMVNGQSTEFLPDLITGDMDSILPETIDKLRGLGANVIVTPDQNDTDYTKALIQLGVYTKSKGINLDGIYVFSATSGRLDHIIANINTLFHSQKHVGDVQLIQVSGYSLTWLLRPGTHKILIPESLLRANSWCALMPIGSRVTSITTTGLKWDLECASLEFGGMVSTSNTYSESPEVTVTTDTPVVWSMDIKPLVETIRPESQGTS